MKRREVGRALIALCAAVGCRKKPAPAAATNDAPGRILDRGKLFPLIVPSGALVGEAPVHVPLLEGLELALSDRDQGTGDGVRHADLRASNLSLREAQQISLANLMALAERGDVRSHSFGAGKGGQPFIVWDGHWLAAASLLLPGLHEIAANALHVEDICAAIPHREAMILFPRGDSTSRTMMHTMIATNESEGRAPITRRFLRLLPGKTPYFEQLPFEWLPEI